jgi:hypothetical protein
LEKLLAAIGGEQVCVSPGALLDARHGERRLTPEEFEQHFGRLPTTARAEEWTTLESEPRQRRAMPLVSVLTFAAVTMWLS